MTTFRGEDSSKKIIEPFVDLVGSQLGWQGEINATGLSTDQKTIGDVQRCLCLAQTHWRLEHIDAGPTDNIDQLLLGGAR